MLITKPSDIKPSEITSKSVYLSRRNFLKTSINTGIAGSVASSGILMSGNAQAAKLDNIQKSPYSTIGEDLTDYDSITTYNNFYEFGTNKEDPAKYSGQFNPKPWSIQVDGECNKPGEIGLEDLIKPHTLEERIYRLRCVEAWSMVIPWVGIPLGDILKRFEPTANAKYVAFSTIFRPDEMPGQRSRVLRWPYLEGLRIDEAMHPLSILSVGLYGEELLNQSGAPIRLVVPWKYGYKSIKSIVKISFVEKQPRTAWNDSAPNEYGFYSNVNPNRNHPRWSQKKERRIGEFLKRETLMFNGYANQVASLYEGMNLLKNH